MDTITLWLHVCFVYCTLINYTLLFCNPVINTKIKSVSIFVNLVKLELSHRFQKLYDNSWYSNVQKESRNLKNVDIDMTILMTKITVTDIQKNDPYIIEKGLL